LPGQSAKRAVKEKNIDANEAFGHSWMLTEFHFLFIKAVDGKSTIATIPLPVDCIWQREKGSLFHCPQDFHHGEEIYNGLQITTNEELDEIG